MSGEPPSYILRVSRDELERQLFIKHSFYVGIKRDWSQGTRVLFARKDVFAGSGVIERFVALDGLEEPEKNLCLENNWYGKIVFSKLVKFQPAVPVQNTPAAGENPLALHGATISGADAMLIERLAPARIIS